MNYIQKIEKLVEEGTTSELQTLKTKKFLTESLQRIRGILVEEGTLDNVKSHLGNNWGKYLAGAGAAGIAGAGVAYSDEIQDAIRDHQTMAGVNDLAEKADETIKAEGFNGVNGGTVETQTPGQQLEQFGRSGMSPESYISPEAQAAQDAAKIANNNNALTDAQAIADARLTDQAKVAPWEVGTNRAR